jgi:hypothetical protein
MAKTKRKKTGGRKEGTPNVLTSTVKMMVLGALAKLGGETWLMKQARKHPQAFMQMLRHIIPTQVVGDMSYRYVARIPAPEENTDEWLTKYAPPPTHPAPPAKQ